jgi:hypothetical protein
MSKIFESPDGGRTVYVREFGSNTKELYIESGSPVKYTYGMWDDILKAGTKNPALQEEIDRLIVIYELGKSNE